MRASNGGMPNGAAPDGLHTTSAAASARGGPAAAAAVEYVLATAQMLALSLTALGELPAKVAWAKERLAQAKVRRRLSSRI